MRLWTIQDLDYWLKCKEAGVMKCDGRRINCYEFRKAYEWMRSQMDLRISDYIGGFPIWAWSRKPDLRTTAGYVRYAPGVCIEFEAPEEKCLASDMDAWHCVLNGYYLPTSEKDCDEFYEKYDLVLDGKRNDDKKKAKAEAIIRKSWERLFDLLLMRQDDNITPEEAKRKQLIQVCIEEVPLGWVRAVRQIKQRSLKNDY